jgi:UDPglucose 6-dehydrogenase
MVDTDAAAIASLADGRPTVFEPELEDQVRRNIAAGRLSFTTDFAAAQREAAIVLLAHDTPLTPDGVDLAPLFEAVRRVARAAPGDFLLVIGSQVPVGVSEELGVAAREANPGVAIDLACTPEFLRLGAAVELFRRPDRVVVGAGDRATATRVAALFAPLARPTLTMSLREAEMVKHATNAFVANSVSFVGEISQLCDELGADALPVGRALRLDKRIGEKAYVLPGLGFNGGTVARDVRVLLGMTRQAGRSAPLLEAVLAVNARQNGLIADRLDEALGGLEGTELGLLGLTYKAKTSTLRSSLTLQISDQLRARGAVLRAWDPIIPAADYESSWGIRPCSGAAEVAEGADALVVMTPKDEFRALDLAGLGGRMRRRVLADPMDVFGLAAARSAGFSYIAIGRGYRVADPADG